MADPIEDERREMAADLASARQLIPMGSTWTNGGGECCFVVGHCVLAEYKATAILYRGDDSIVWCHPADQFLDGRFLRAGEARPGAVGTRPAVRRSRP